MMPDLAPNKTIELPSADNQSRQLFYVGPASHGWIYRDAERTSVYRLLSVRGHSAEDSVPRLRSDDAPIERRHAIVKWTDSAHTAADRPFWLAHSRQHCLIPPAEAQMHELAGWGSTFVVRYESQFNANLLEVLSDPDPLVRLGHMVQVLSSMNRWLACLGHDIVPLPADIVFEKDGQAYLLVLPQWRLPDADAVIAAPQRALYLAPEYVRGMDPKAIGYNANRYAIGAMLLQCLYEVPRSATSRLLLQAAKGTLWHTTPNLLAYWQQQSSGIRQALALARQLIDTRPEVRSAVSIEDLGHNLQQWVDQIRPQKALNELVNRADWEAADRLLQDVLLVEKSYKIFCLAAEITTRRGRFLDAAQYCEKAIELQPQREQAYLQQFQILTSEGARQELQMLIEKRPDLGQRIDSQVARDFRMLPEAWRTDDRVGSLAEHMVWRGQYKEAAVFLHDALAAPTVLESDGAVSELRVPLHLLLIKVLARTEPGRPRTLARQAVADLHREIRTKYDQGKLEPQTVEILGDLCRDMEEMIKGLEAKSINPKDMT